GDRPRLQPHTARGATRLASAGQLMAQGGGLSLPRLTNVPTTQRMIAGDQLAMSLAESLVKLDIALPEDWNKAEHDPTSYIRITLERWIEAHGGAAIRRRFLLAAAISTVPCEWAEQDESQSHQLFLTVEPTEASCGCVVFGPTLDMLERVDPRLPATFFHLLVGALNCWTRTYDYRDAEERVETLREWTAPEPNLIIPFSPGDAASVQSAFRTFAVACETLAAASRLVDLMPGNDKYVISG